MFDKAKAPPPPQFFASASFSYTDTHSLGHLSSACIYPLVNNLNSAMGGKADLVKKAIILSAAVLS